MQVNRFLKMGMLTILGLALMAGCTAKAESNEQNITVEGVSVTDVPNCEPIDAVETTDENNMEDDYDIVGDIIEIDGNSVHILFGDIVEIFEVTNAGDFYLGETVKIVGKKGSQSLEPFTQTNFEIRHTNMGHLIETVKGTITSVNDKGFVLETDSGKVEFETFESSTEAYTLGKGMEVEVDYIMFNGPNTEKTLLQVYPTETEMKLTVQSIDKSGAGLMMINAIEDNGMESIIDIQGTNYNFNMSELKKGDIIKVIPGMIMESYPMQVRPLRVTLVK